MNLIHLPLSFYLSDQRYWWQNSLSITFFLFAHISLSPFHRKEFLSHWPTQRILHTHGKVDKKACPSSASTEHDNERISRSISSKRGGGRQAQYPPINAIRRVVNCFLSFYIPCYEGDLDIRSLDNPKAGLQHQKTKITWKPVLVQGRPGPPMWRNAIIPFWTCCTRLFYVLLFLLL